MTETTAANPELLADQVSSLLMQPLEVASVVLSSGPVSSIRPACCVSRSWSAAPLPRLWVRVAIFQTLPMSTSTKWCFCRPNASPSRLLSGSPMNLCASRLSALMRC